MGIKFSAFLSKIWYDNLILIFHPVHRRLSCTALRSRSSILRLFWERRNKAAQSHRAAERCQPPESWAISERFIRPSGWQPRGARKQAHVCGETRSAASLRPLRQAHGWKPALMRGPPRGPTMVPRWAADPADSPGHTRCWPPCMPTRQGEESGRQKLFPEAAWPGKCTWPLEP